MNTNCLEGMVCPQCESEGPFNIQVSAIATVYDDGIEDSVNYEWEDESPCTCLSCKHDGTVADFMIKATTYTYRINDLGRREVAAWLLTHHKNGWDIVPQYLDAWCAIAERSMDHGNSPHIEILAHESLNGEVQILDLDRNGIDRIEE